MMRKKPAGRFSEIARVDETAFEPVSMLDVFGVGFPDEAYGLVGRATEGGILHPGFGGSPLPEIQPPPPGEPKGALIADPRMFRSGLMCTIIEVEGRNVLEGASVYFSEGIQHRFALDGITLSRHRGLGVLHGTIAGIVQISAFEPSFVSDRQWHGAGSVHDVLLYGVPYSFEVGSPPPIEMPDRLSGDGSGVEHILLDHAAILLPIKEAPRSFYTLLGPATRVEPYELPVLGKRVWAIDATVARAGADQDIDIDIRLFLPETILDGRTLPRPGDPIRANIRLCARLWSPNVTA